MPEDMVEITDLDQARKLMRLVDALEDHDDVQAVAANFRLADDIAKQIGEES